MQRLTTRSFLGILIAMILCITTAMAFADDRDSSGSESFYWSPSTTRDGVTTYVEVDWEISQNLGQITYRFSIGFRMIGDYLYLDGERYERHELGIAWEKVQVADSLYEMNAELSAIGHGILGDGKLTRWQSDTLLGLSTTFDVPNSTLKDIYDNSIFKLRLEEFEITKMEFLGLSDVRSYLRAIARAAEEEAERKAEIDYAYEVAQDYYVDDYWELAIGAYQDAIKLDPNDSRVRTARTRIEICTDKLDAEAEQAAADRENERLAQEREDARAAAALEAEFNMSQKQRQEQQIAEMNRQLVEGLMALGATFDYSFVGFGPSIMMRQQHDGVLVPDPQKLTLIGIGARFRGGWALVIPDAPIAFGAGFIVGTNVHMGDEVTYNDLYPGDNVTVSDMVILPHVGGSVHVFGPGFRAGLDIGIGWATHMDADPSASVFLIGVQAKFGHFSIGLEFPIFNYDDEYYEYADEYNSGTRTSVSVFWEPTIGF